MQYRDRDWESDVVERIRRGLEAPHSVSVYDAVAAGCGDANSQGWEHAENRSFDANRLHSAYLTDAQVAARQAKRKMLRQAVQEAVSERAAKAAEAYAANREADRIREARWAQERAERDRAAAEWKRRQEARTAELRERNEEWSREYDRRKIMQSRWTCNACGERARIKDVNAGYEISCMACGKRAWGSHEKLVKALG